MNTTPMHMMAKTTKALLQESLPEAISYRAYRENVSRLAAAGKSTGAEQTEALTNYTLLNDRRMKRFDKTVKIDAETVSKIKSVRETIRLVVLTESWCGDAAPTMPVMNKIAEINDKINFKILLRDEHTQLMHRFKTNGALSIPKLIVLDAENEILATWGPRPKPAAQLVLNHKEKYGELLPEIKEEIQHWYNNDKGQTTLEEIVDLLPV